MKKRKLVIIENDEDVIRKQIKKGEEKLKKLKNQLNNLKKKKKN